MNKCVVFFFVLFALTENVYGVGAPTLNSPASNITDVRARITLMWNSVSQARYQYQLDTSDAFGSSLLQMPATATPFTNVVVRTLRFNTKYFWRVRAIVGPDTSVWSAVRNFTTIDRFEFTSNLNNSTTISPTFSLNFKMTGAVVRLYCDTSPDFNSPGLIDTIFSDTNYSASLHPTNTGFILSRLFFGKKHYLKALAYHTEDSLPVSVTLSFTTKVKTSVNSPSINSTAAVSFSPSAVVLSYLSTDPDYFYQFEVDTATDFSSGYKRELIKQYSQNTSFLLYFNQKYYIRVRAWHARDTCDWSAMTAFTTVKNPSLIFPMSGVTTINVDSEHFQTNTIEGVINYEYKIDTTNLFNSPLLVNNAVQPDANGYGNADIKNLYFGQTYYVAIRALSAIDTSEWLMNTYTAASGATPTTPTNQSTFMNTNTVLAWKSFKNVTACTIQVDTSAAFTSSELWQKDTGNITTIALPDLRYDQKYYWRVKLRTDYDTSDWSVNYWFSTSPYAVYINAPLNNTTNVAVNPTQIAWNTPAGARGYNYQVSRDSLFNDTSVAFNVFINDGTKSVDDLQGLSYSTRYFMRVRCFNHVDTADWYYLNVFTTVNEPPTPVAPLLTSPVNNASNQNYTQLTLTWQAVANATSYEVHTATTEAFLSPVAATFTQTSAVLTGLNPGTLFYWRVRAKNGDRTGPWSATFKFTTVVSVVPPVNLKPDNFTGTPYSSALLMWDAVTGAEYYQFQYSNNPSLFGAMLQTDQTQYVLNGLGANLTYYWRIRTVIAGYASGWSEIATFRTAVTGLNDLAADPELRLFPNPSEGMINIPAALLQKTSRVELMDVQGRIVYVSSEPKASLDLSGFANGIYLLKLITKDGAMMQQRVEKR